jgi:hypothetical protein
VLKRESGKEGFPDLLRAQKLGRAVGVRTRPQRDEAPIHCVFEQVVFMLVQSHPGIFFGVRSMARSAVVTSARPRAPRVKIQRYWMPRAWNRPQARDIFVALNHAVDEQGDGRKILQTMSAPQPA